MPAPGPWLSPPRLADPTDEAKARAIFSVVVVMVPVAILWGVASLFAAHSWQRVLTLDLTFCSAGVSGLFLARRGQVTLGAWLLVSMLFLGVAGACVSAGGVQATAFFSLGAIILIAGVLIDGRAGLIVLGASVAFGFLLMLGSRAGLFPIPPILARPASRFIGGTLIFCTVAVLQRLADGMARRALEAAKVELAERQRAEAARAKALEELSKLNHELEARVQERTLELEQRGRELALVNKELESLTWSTAHDLRAPARAIDGFTRWILEEEGHKLSDTAREDLQRVRRSAARMDEMINALLAFARVGRQQILPATLPADELRAMVDGVISELRASAADRSVDFVVGPLLPCKADATLLRAVFANLLGNAFKFTRPRPPGHIELTCEARAGKVAYRVRDDGVGFDGSFAHKLFRPFERLHGPQFEGHGVGLAMVARIIERHDGTVVAEGEVAHGASFVFTLPAA